MSHASHREWWHLFSTILVQCRKLVTYFLTTCMGVGKHLNINYVRVGVPDGPCMVSGNMLPISDAISDVSRIVRNIFYASLRHRVYGGTLNVFVVRREFHYIFCFSYVKDRTKMKERGEEKSRPSPSPRISFPSTPLFLSTTPSFFLF